VEFEDVPANLDADGLTFRLGRSLLSIICRRLSLPTLPGKSSAMLDFPRRQVLAFCIPSAEVSWCCRSGGRGAWLGSSCFGARRWDGTVWVFSPAVDE
jgi:hypothetical protein